MLYLNLDEKTYQKESFNKKDYDFTGNIKFTYKVNYDVITTYEFSEKNPKYKMILTHSLKRYIVHTKSSSPLYLFTLMLINYNVKTFEELKPFFDNKISFSVEFLNDKAKYTEHLKLLVLFLNMDCGTYDGSFLEAELKNKYNLELSGRGIQGERPRELKYKFGFPIYSHYTDKSLKMNEYKVVSKLPYLPKNTSRKAINIIDNKKCFTCNRQEGDKNIWGEVCRFEKGHLNPVNVDNNSVKSYNQCKWCNTFYKDYINFDMEKQKIKINEYAIIRDMPKKKLKKILKELNYDIKIDIKDDKK